MQARAAALILDAFLDYNARFSDITRRAQRWFERRNWKQAQIDVVWRLDLYDECVIETLGRLELLLDELGDFEVRAMEQLDGLSQLRGHHQRLRLPDFEPGTECRG